jgi:MFS superfamily sulfate permease-like transporter
MIAYASLAGLPPQAGLYTLLASLALYAIFGTSRHRWWREPRPRPCWSSRP